MVFFGDKHGRLGIWEPLAPPEEVKDEDGEVEVLEGRHWCIQPHWPATSKSSISAVKVDPIDAHSVSAERSYPRILIGDQASQCHMPLFLDLH